MIGPAFGDRDADQSKASKINIMKSLSGVIGGTPDQIVLVYCA